MVSGVSFKNNVSRERQIIKKGSSIAVLVIFGLILLTLLLFGAVYYFNGQALLEKDALDAEKVQQEKALENALDDQNARAILQYSWVDQLVYQGTTTQKVFQQLESKLVNGVFFTRVTHTYDDGLELLEISGIVENLDKMALQLLEWEDDPFFDDVNIISTERDLETGEVVFAATATVAPDADFTSISDLWRGEIDDSNTNQF